MDEGDAYSESFDAALRDIFPDDLEAEVPEVSGECGGTAYTDRLGRDYTLLNTVSQSELQSLSASQTQPYVERFDGSKGTATTAQSLLFQYLQSLDGAHIVEIYAGAAFYCAGKVQELGYTPDEIADAGPDLLTRKTLLRASKRIASELGLDPTLFTDVSQYVDRFYSELDVPDPVRERANEIIDECDEVGLSSGKSPTGWAAAAIYLSSLESGEKLRQQEIADVVGVSQVTIRNRYQEQQELLQQHDSPGETLPEHIEWLADRANLDDEVSATAVRAWGVLKESTHAWRGIGDEVVALRDAFTEEPSIWAGALLLLAAEVLNESLTTRRLTSILDTDGADLKRRRRTLRNVVKAEDNSHYDSSTLAE